jgi:hypothetical protein
MRNERSEHITSDRKTGESERLSTLELIIKKFKLLPPSLNTQMFTFHTLVSAGAVEVFWFFTFSYTILHKLNKDIPIFTIHCGMQTQVQTQLVYVAVSRENTTYPSPKYDLCSFVWLGEKHLNYINFNRKTFGRSHLENVLSCHEALTSLNSVWIGDTSTD